MQTVSSDYKTQINNTLRNFSYIKVNFGIVDPDAANSATFSDNGSLYFSENDYLGQSKLIENRYGTFERNKFILDGSILLPPEITDPITYYQGFIGSEISDNSGNFSTNPLLTISFGGTFKFIGLTLKFDDILNIYPTSMNVKAYLSDVEVYSGNITPTSSNHILEAAIPATGYCDKITLEFVSMNVPHRRAVLSYIMFGVVKTFTEEQITDSTWKRVIDLATAKLPTNTFSFTFLDPLKEYNPESPTGIWSYLEERQPVTFEYGYELENGTIEWIPGNALYTDGKFSFKTDSVLSSVTIGATSLLAQLTDTYYRGVYNASGISLYDLALDVLDFANLDPLSDGSDPWDIDTSLQNIITKVPVPEITIREALQLIANAGRCLLYISRSGKITIKPASTSLNDFSLDFSNIQNPPVISKGEVLLSVDTYNNNIVVDSIATELFTGSVALSEATQCIFKYDSATDISLSVGTGLTITVPAVYYAGSCIVTLNGSGTVIITGKKLTILKDSISYVAGTSGYNCPIENVLLNTSTDALAYATWIADVLLRKNEYAVDDRGYPELDVDDVISVDTLFETDAQATVTSIALKYNGTLSAKTSYVTKEV